ncbi:hypothetical protein OROHE_013146 [Orobanche hederae]
MDGNESSGSRAAPSKARLELELESSSSNLLVGS